MTIVGFNFTKIHAEKTNPIKGKINISNKVALTGVEKSDISLGKDDQQGVKFLFNYTSTYEPKIGTVELDGDLLFLSSAKEVKEIVDGWTKDKKIPQAVMSSVINAVLTKCNLQALISSRDINLPPSIQLPKVKIKQQ
jgi:hypothetical protein